MSNPIKKIVIEVGGVELALSPEDAKKLHKALDEIYGRSAVQFIPQPYPVPTPVDPFYRRPWIHWSALEKTGVNPQWGDGVIRCLTALDKSNLLSS